MPLRHTLVTDAKILPDSAHLGLWAAGKIDMAIPPEKTQQDQVFFAWNMVVRLTNMVDQLSRPSKR